MLLKSLDCFYQEFKLRMDLKKYIYIDDKHFQAISYAKLQQQMTKQLIAIHNKKLKG